MIGVLSFVPGEEFRALIRKEGPIERVMQGYMRFRVEGSKQRFWQPEAQGWNHIYINVTGLRGLGYRDLGA